MSAHQTFALVLFAIALCYAHDQKYCGRSLARALAVLCYEVNPDHFEKRSEGTMYNAILSPYYKAQELQYIWGLSHKTRPLSLPSRGKRYIITECCDKPCTLNELMSYCDI